uniref:Thiamine pyrimidine synthase n=1 Tax=Candidatus Kentrum eta TaxID=2126337 RepID=A0A450V5L7_9GAMM|nr:MAG: ABC-type nitrate/sulfonate/bicarbonate transport system, substrate-binding protein [Candidatus Kentron sp. H]VFK00078.1 MAG: ABC-type nitrate/sulfonate/bicarbonate transport system, substrate-binding protein [Candidatus Kentron sp. H]VFK04403.1 MAG: ABC-type nitrate/sulfonate/bicarbonate transport system, substrate-binding protein [Candidatus Kentron sp. H]
MSKRFIAGIAAVAIVAAGMALYFGSNNAIHVDNDNGKPEKVSVRMKWFFAGTMTGWFAGKQEGIFERRGIDLTITPGGPDNNSVKLVAAGTDLFGVAGADEVLLARAKGIPVVAIGVLFKESPICFISKKAKSIQTPEDWASKTVEVSYGSNAEVQYRALVAKYNVGDIKEVPYTFSLAPFIDNKADVSVAYKMDQVVTLQRKGVDLSIITAKEHGINPYGDVVITTEATLKAKPELVRSFMAAVVESHAWAIQNPAPAVRLLVDNTGGNLTVENEGEVWRETIPFLTADGGLDELGRMTTARWKETSDILVEYAQLDSATDIGKAFVNIVDEK